jgi:hypothetical protein
VGSLCQRERECCAAERREAPTGGSWLLEGEREGARGLRLGNREELGWAWLLGRENKRGGERREGDGPPVKENGPEEKGRKRGKGLGPRTWRVGLPAGLLFSFSFLFQNNSIQFEFKWDLNSNSAIQTNKIVAPA